MRLGLVYLPDAAASAGCIRLSERLVVGRSPRVVLGRGRANNEALPHVTLVHVETDEAAEPFWAEASAAVPREISMRFAALAFLPYHHAYNAPPAARAMMAYAIIPCSAELRSAEERALGLALVRRNGSTTGNRERFLPHVTLAIWEGDEPPAVWTLPSDLAGAACHGRLALGVIGPNGVYERTLFEA